MKKVFLFSAMMLAMLFMVNVSAQDDVKKEKKLKLSADVRFRVEMDRNSDNSDGTTRADRDRFRYRARFGASYALNKNFEFGMRFRSGNPANQQSPHVTLGKGMDSDQFSIDKAYIKVKSNNGLWAWAGKNSMPFWEQNELLWDGDVNPEGLSFGGNFKLGDNAKLVPVLGYYVLDQNSVTDTDGTTTQKFGDASNMNLFQVKFCNKFGDDKLTISTGIVNATLKDDFETTDDFKYNIWATSLQYKMKNIGLTFGLDYFSNLADYADLTKAVYDDVTETYVIVDAVSDRFEDQKTGYDVSVKYGKGKFGAAFTYAAIQQYAVVDMFAQDDWVRWGNSDMTRSSNFQGFELNFKYKFTSKFNTTLRFWNVEGIEIRDGGTDLETGTRIRLDFNIKF